MPRIGNCQNGKIYSIRSHQTDDIYIGSTCQTLAQRLAYHNKDYKKYLTNTHSYITSFKIISLGDAYIELIENFPCSCKDELLKREGEIIRTTKCVNICIPKRTLKEWYCDNIEKIKQNYENNKVIIAEKRKIYQKLNADKIKERRNKKFLCECSGSYSHMNKRNHEQTIKHKTFMNYKNKILTYNIETTCLDIQKQENQQENIEEGL